MRGKGRIGFVRSNEVRKEEGKWRCKRMGRGEGDIRCPRRLSVLDATLKLVSMVTWV